MSDVDVLILGGGPTGLGAACRLAVYPGAEWMLCEAQDTLGGLSCSFTDDAGYTWDIGGHVFFSHYDYITDALVQALGPEGLLEHTREAWVRIGASWVPYPFQNNLHRLPAAERERCVRGLIDVAGAGIAAPARPRDFAEFVTATFGEGIAELFMRPYNEKVWAHPLDMLSYGWIGERVSVPDPETIVANAASATDDVDWGPNSQFMFPARGGTGAFWSAIGGLLPPGRVKTNARAVAVDAENKRVEFADGSAVGYRHLIATLPLDVTAEMTGDQELRELTSRLRHSSVHVLGLGVDGAVGERLGTKCWVYFPEREVPFYRVTNFSHYSPEHVPAGSGTASLLVEVSESEYRPVDADSLPAEVVGALVSTGILRDAAEVSHVWTHRAEHGYPTPTIDRDEVLRAAFARLESRGILSRGRFGGWRYEVGNMDHSFAQGFEAAERALTDFAELTLWHPEIVNAPR